MDKQIMINEICDKLSIGRLESMKNMNLNDVQTLHSTIEELHEELQEIKEMLLMNKI